MSKLKSLDELFAGRHFDRDVIILCVRWYLRYKLSLRDLVEMMAERGLSLAHTTNSALGAALCAGIRQAVEPLWQAHRPVVACRRECVTNISESLWCCTEDGSGPPGAGLQEQASNRPVLLRSKGVVVSDRGKVILKGGRCVLSR